MNEMCDIFIMCFVLFLFVTCFVLGGISTLSWWWRRREGGRAEEKGGRRRSLWV
jgi:hypothetical protein